jgi:hypothetical protein
MMLRTCENRWMKERSVSPACCVNGVQVSLVAWSRVCALKVGHELAAQLLPGHEASLRQVHEP